MSGPTLHRASAVSFIAHLVFFVIVILFANRSSISTPRVYTVKIVNPVVEKSQHKPSASKPRVEKANTPVKKTVTAPPVSEPKIPPKKTIKKDQAVAPQKAPKSVEKKENMQEYLSKKLSALKSRRQDENYKEEQLNKIESHKRLDAIRQNALLKGSQIEAAQNLAEAEAARSRILDEYLARISDVIYENIKFPDIDTKGLEAHIAITIMKNGVIIVEKTVNSSGNKPFDRAAWNGIQKSSPLEPPPFGKNLEKIIIRVHRRE